MQLEITTAEAVELFSVTRKTIADWTAKEIMAKTAHGTFELKKSLMNFIDYRDTLRNGGTLEDWLMLRADREYQRDHPPIDYSQIDMSKVEFAPLVTLDRTFVWEQLSDGSLGRLLGEEVDDGQGGKKTVPIEDDDAAPGDA